MTDDLVTTLHLKPATDFEGPPESGIVEWITVSLVHGVSPLHGFEGGEPVGEPTIHKIDDRGIWCSDGDYSPKSDSLSGAGFVFRLTLIPWSNVREVGFTAAT